MGNIGEILAGPALRSRSASLNPSLHNIRADQFTIRDERDLFRIMIFPKPKTPEEVKLIQKAGKFGIPLSAHSKTYFILSREEYFKRLTILTGIYDNAPKLVRYLIKKGLDIADYVKNEDSPETARHRINRLATFIKKLEKGSSSFFQRFIDFFSHSRVIVDLISRLFVKDYRHIGPDQNPCDILSRNPQILGFKKLMEIAELGEKEQDKQIKSLKDAWKTFKIIQNKPLGQITDSEIRQIQVLPGMSACITQDISELMANNDYLKHLRDKYPALSLPEFFSFSIALTRNLKNGIETNLKHISGDRIKAEIDNLMAFKHKIYSHRLFGAGVNVIVATHKRQFAVGDFYFSPFTKLAKRHGSYIAYAESGPKSTDALLKQISNSRGRTTVFLGGHGSPSEISFGRSTLSFIDLADAVAKSQKPEEMTIIVMCCRGYEFGTRSFEEYYRHKYPDKPIPNLIVIGANDGTNTGPSLAYWFGMGKIGDPTIGGFVRFFDKNFFEAAYTSKRNLNFDISVRVGRKNSLYSHNRLPSTKKDQKESEVNPRSSLFFSNGSPFTIITDKDIENIINAKDGKKEKVQPKYELLEISQREYVKSSMAT